MEYISLQTETIRTRFLCVGRGCHSLGDLYHQTLEVGIKESRQEKTKQKHQISTWDLLVTKQKYLVNTHIQYWKNFSVQ